jgi:hypothetical protein
MQVNVWCAIVYHHLLGLVWIHYSASKKSSCHTFLLCITMVVGLGLYFFFLCPFVMHDDDDFFSSSLSFLLQRCLRDVQLHYCCPLFLDLLFLDFSYIKCVVHMCRLFYFAMDEIKFCIIEFIGRVSKDIYTKRTSRTFNYVQGNMLDVENVLLLI